MISDFELKVKTEMLRQETTGRTIAKELGISQGYFSDIIKGNRKAEPVKKKICERLGIDYADNAQQEREH